MTEDAGFLDDYLLYLLARASAAASAQFHAELSDLGVAVPTWRIIAVLSDGSTTVGALAAAVMLKQATLSKALDRLERDGLVARERQGQDRRQVRIVLTPSGRALADTLIPRARAHQEQLLAPYSETQRAVLRDVLHDLLAMAGRNG
ncbi:MAG: MarR family transcriptional regulator [Pseudomonadota bacterium]